MKVLNWNDEYVDAKMRLSIDTYKTNQSCMALSLLMSDSNEPYDSLSVNLLDSDEILPKYHAYIDVNNSPEAEQILQDSCLAHPTGAMRMSGFVIYPLYEFDKKVLSEYVPTEDLQRYERLYDSYVKSVAASRRRMPDLGGIEQAFDDDLTL